MVGQLAGSEMLTIYWQSPSVSALLCGQHLGNTSCGWLLHTGMPNHCIGKCKCWMISVYVYLLWVPHLGAISVTGFLSLLPCKERFKHWAHRIKDTEMLDILNGVGIS